MKAYIELTQDLPRPLPLEALVWCFTQDHVLMTKHEGHATLPRARVEPQEALAKTVRRETYYTTGALLRHAEMLGVFWFKDSKTTTPVAVYLGIIERFEKPVLKNGKTLTHITQLSRALREWYWTRTLQYLTYHAWKQHQRLKGIPP